MRAATEHDGKPAKPRRWLLSVVLYGILSTVLLAATCGYYELVDYIEHDPGFCRNCHESQGEYTLWTESEHRQLVCQECHHQSRREALSLLRKFVFEGQRGATVGNRDKLHQPTVLGGACARCHLSHDRGWPEIGESVGHKVHLRDGRVDCMQCHARSIHRFGAASDACLECHEGRSLRTSGMERLHCLACHNFLTTGETIKPSRSVCYDCHTARGVDEPLFSDGAPMATFSCRDCHHPHKPEGARDVACTSCHDEMARAGLHAEDGHDDCLDCHAAHTWIPSAERCSACHDDVAAHGDGGPCWRCHSFDLVEGSDVPP